MGKNKKCKNWTAIQGKNCRKDRTIRAKRMKGRVVKGGWIDQQAIQA